MQDGYISSIEFHKVLQEMEKYRKLKADIRNQTKAKLNKSQRNSDKNYLNKEEKKVRKIFLGKFANTSGIQGASAI